MGYDLADPVPLTVQTYDSTGALADAGNVTLTITHVASDTLFTPTPSHPSTGVYQYDFVPTANGSLAGYYKVRWVATGANLSGYSDVFHVYDATPNYLISLAEARAVLRLTATTQDEDLRPYLEAVTEVVEDHLGETVVPRTFVEDYEDVKPDRWGNSLSLRRVPVLSVASIVSVDGLFTWDVADFHIDKTTGLVTSLPSTWGLFGNITITYTAGYAVIPARVQKAAGVIVQHMWQTRRGAAGTAVPGGMADTAHSSYRSGWGYAIPNAALELLGVGSPAGFA